MASSPAEMEAILVKQIKEETGKDYKAWAKLLVKDGPEKYREQIKWLKEKGLKHGQASIMASIFKNEGELVYGDPEKLINEQYSGKSAAMRPLFDALTSKMNSTFTDSEMHVCKGYISYVAKQQYVTIHPAKEEIKIGLALRDYKIESKRLQNFAKGKNSADKITHYISIKSESDIDEDLMNILEKVKTPYS